MTHREALARLKALVAANEGCPIPDLQMGAGCDCESSDDCVLKDVLATGDQAVLDQEELARAKRAVLDHFLPPGGRT